MNTQLEEEQSTEIEQLYEMIKELEEDNKKLKQRVGELLNAE